MTEAEIREWENWAPSPSHLKWMIEIIRPVADLGSWAVPINKTVYRIDKTRRQLTLIHGLWCVNRDCGFFCGLPGDAEYKEKFTTLERSDEGKIEVHEHQGRPGKCPKCGAPSVLRHSQVDKLFYQNKKCLEQLGWTLDVTPEAALGTGTGKTDTARTFVAVEPGNLPAALPSAVEEPVWSRCPRCQLHFDKAPGLCPNCGSTMTVRE
jgi:hypothetical protein